MLREAGVDPERKDAGLVSARCDEEPSASPAPATPGAADDLLG